VHLIPGDQHDDFAPATLFRHEGVMLMIGELVSKRTRRLQYPLAGLGTHARLA